MKIFQVEVRRYDRREGTSNWVRNKFPATGPATAGARGIREYMRGLTRKDRRDAAKLIEVRVTLIGKLTHATLKDAPPEVYALVDRMIDEAQS